MESSAKTAAQSCACHMTAAAVLERPYPFRAERKVIYANTSGVCTLQCPYCFTNQLKGKDCLGKRDFEAIFRLLGENIFFIFSGVGDFFAGYRKSERLLEYILAHDVSLFLDFNGVLVHELPEIAGAHLDKFRFLDISFHYSAMKEKNLLDLWTHNAAAVSRTLPHDRLIFKTIFTRREMELWPEILQFYESKVYPLTGKPLSIALDDFDPDIRDRAVVTLLNKLIQVVGEPVQQNLFTPRRSRTEAKALHSVFTEKTARIARCPAGTRFFKIGGNGSIAPCNYLKDEKKITLGNLRQGVIDLLPAPVSCQPLRGPGCLWNWDQKYPE